MQTFVSLALLVAVALFAVAALRSGGAGELWWALATAALIADTFVIVRARVLTIPFFFVFIIILLFWSARRHAERKDAEEGR